MGYLNNSSRILDAILTKKGREILSSGGDFTVTKFALGDDEVDYSLWDTTHTRGTDYYGAVIDNLPALEPFNDPSEIMKYKLVTRQEGTRAMVQLTSPSPAITGSSAIEWYADANSGANRVVVRPNSLGIAGELGGGSKGSTGFTINRTSNFQQGNLDFSLLAGETYTVTVLDSSVAILAPEFETEFPGKGAGKGKGAGDFGKGAGAGFGAPAPPIDFVQTQGTAGSLTTQDKKWAPFVDNVQHISQTFSGVSISSGKLVLSGTIGTSGDPELLLYAKQVSADSSTSVIVTGELSGAVKEFPVMVKKL
jgi:hypothetical protein